MTKYANVCIISFTLHKGVHEHCTFCTCISYIYDLVHKNLKFPPKLKVGINHKHKAGSGQRVNLTFLTYLTFLTRRKMLRVTFHMNPV